MIKKLIYVFAAIFLISLPVNARFDMATPVEGESIANDELQFEVIMLLYKTISPQMPACTEYSIDDTQVLHYPYDVKKNKNGDYTKGYWNELWTVDACGTKKQFPVKFIINKHQTVFTIDKYFLN